jgi:hypothetical protein
MSVNTPPTENIPIFDPSVFPSASGTALTIASGSKYFLTYPVAQGSEIFPSNVTLQSTLTDASGDVGTSGQILSSTGTGTNWINSSSNNATINYNTSSLPFTLPVPAQANTYYTFTGTTPAGGILTIPISGITTGTYIFIKNLSSTVGMNILTTYVKFGTSTTSTAARSIPNGANIALYFNGSYWVETQFTNFLYNVNVSGYIDMDATAVMYTNRIDKSLTSGLGTETTLFKTLTQTDLSICETLPSPYIVRIANTTAGASGGSVYCSNVGFDGSGINNALDPTGASGGNLKLGHALTSGPLYIGGGANTAVHTTGPIIIGSDSTATGGINIGTGTNQTVPTVNTVNIGSATYATNIKGTLSTLGITSASGNITATSGNITASAGSVSASTTITAGTGITSTTGNISASAGSVSANTTITAGTGITATTGNISASSGSVSTTSGSITSAGVITGTSVIAPSFNASGDTITVGISTTQTSGVLNIGTGSRTTGGTINIGTGSGATANPINIGGAGTITTFANGLTQASGKYITTSHTGTITAPIASQVGGIVNGTSLGTSGPSTSGRVTSIGQIDLTAGVWILNATRAYNNSNNCTRILFSFGSALRTNDVLNGTTDILYGTVTPPLTSATFYANLTGITTLTSGSSIYLNILSEFATAASYPASNFVLSAVRIA